jgi:hypothetical protein
MEDLFKPVDEKRGVNKPLVGGMIVGIVLIGLAIYLLSFKPSMEDQTARILAGSYQEGSPEFAELNKDIIISTDDSTVESPMGTGRISMFIHGKIRNKGSRMISVLEVSVSVVTESNQPLRERKILVVPVQQPSLGSGEIIPITLTLDGFSKDDDRANIRWKVTAIKAEK